jgi:hypothetical protein
VLVGTAGWLAAGWQAARLSIATIMKLNHATNFRLNELLDLIFILILRTNARHTALGVDNWRRLLKLITYPTPLIAPLCAYTEGNKYQM